MRRTNKYVLLLLKISQILLVIVGVYCALMITITRLDISMESGALLLTLAIASVSLYLIFKYLEQFPLGHWIGLISLCMLYIVFTIRFFQPLKRGLIYTINSFLKVLMDYSETKMELLSYSKASQSFSNVYCATILFCYIGVMLVAIISITFYRRRNVGVYLLCTIPFVLLPLTIGNVGYYNHIIPYIIVTGAAFATGHFRDESKEQIVRQKVSIIVACILGVISVIAFLICPPSRYSEQEEKITNIKKSIIQMASWDSGDMVSWFQSNFSSDAINYGKVGDIPELKYTGKKLLEISTTQKPGSEGIYLKSFVGDCYKDGTWSSLKDIAAYRNDLSKLKQNQVSPETLSAKIIGAVTNSQGPYLRMDWDPDLSPFVIEDVIHIKNIAFGRGTNVVPYYNEGGVETWEDGKLDLQESLEYNITYYPAYLKNPETMQNDVKEELLPELVDVDPKYKDLQNQIAKTKEFVNKYYRNIPVNWDKNVLSDFTQKAAIEETSHGDEPMSLTQKVNFVQKYLKQNTKYTLAPGATPSGVDPIDYFLNKNKKGYCIYYATAATLMLRSWGVPCRYVEGVQVEESKFENNDGKYNAKVVDRDAHAWVEVYYEDVGFVPFEVTPGARRDDDKEDGSSKATSSPNPGGKQTPTPSPAQDPKKTGAEQSAKKPVYSQVPEENMEFEDVQNAKTKDELDDEKQSADGKVGSAKVNGSGSAVLKKIWKVLKPILIILLVLLLIQGQCIFRRRRYSAQLKKLDRSKRVLLMYRHIKSLMRHKGVLYTGQSSHEYSDELAIALELDDRVVNPYVTYLLKAYFGGEPLSKEEFAEYQKSYRRMYKQMQQKQSWTLRIIYRYVLNI